MCVAGIRTEVNSSSIIREISEEDLKSMIAVNPDLKLLDVRESWEREQSQISPSIHQPLGKLIEQISSSSPLELDQNQACGLLQSGSPESCSLSGITVWLIHPTLQSFLRYRRVGSIVYRSLD